MQNKIRQGWFCCEKLRCGISDVLFFFAVDGSSDDLDEPIKEIFKDWEYVQKHHLCSINSINWARILVQVSYKTIPYLLWLRKQYAALG